MGRRAVYGTREVPRMKSEQIIEMIRENITSFLIGWIFGMGLFPVLWNQITAAL